MRRLTRFWRYLRGSVAQAWRDSNKSEMQGEYRLGRNPSPHCAMGYHQLGCPSTVCTCSCHKEGR